MSKSYIDTDPGIESQSIELLPGSIVLKILHELAPQELASVGSCSTSWKQLVGNDVDVAKKWKSARKQMASAGRISALPELVKTVRGEDDATRLLSRTI